jgi:subtilisin-like proprotein convertase family protein
MMGARILTVVLAALLVLPAVPNSPTVEAKKKFRTKTVTETFSNTGNIAIPGAGTEGNASPFPSPIEVGGFKQGQILDVNVTLNNVSHAEIGNVGVMVVAPNGKGAILMNDAGSGPVANINLTFDDEATAKIPDDGAVTSGSFLASVYEASNSTAPYLALSAFDASNPNGTWQLFVFDDSNNDTGSIAGGWTLTIEAKEKVKVKNKKKNKKK